MKLGIASIALLVSFVASACVPEPEPEPEPPPPPPAAAYFETSPAIEGLTAPMAVRFSDSGRVFVAEREGIVKSFDSLDDDTATVVADLRDDVSTMWDRAFSWLATA